MAPDSVFSWPTRVYWEDTDAGGVVYHAQYLAFLERARSEWLRARGQGQEWLRREHDLVFAVRAMRIDFRLPARLDDALEVTVALLQCRRASLTLAQTVRREGALLLEAQVRVAALGAGDFRPRAIPAPLYQALKSLETTDPRQDTDGA
nr:tol-pal system-associated acyl-CoA thioesterase [Luteimonas weifangensis]